MDTIRFLELPGIADLEEQYSLYLENRLMKPEREELERRLDEKSIDLFGITELDTMHWRLPAGVKTETADQWERHFAFIEEPCEEEGDFWDFFGIDVTDGDGMQLACMYSFGRQLVCALKRLHPGAGLSFVTDQKTETQLEAAAEAWGRRLLGRP